MEQDLNTVPLRQRPYCLEIIGVLSLLRAINVPYTLLDVDTVSSVGKGTQAHAVIFSEEVGILHCLVVASPRASENSEMNQSVTIRHIMGRVPACAVRLPILLMGLMYLNSTTKYGSFWFDMNTGDFGFQTTHRLHFGRIHSADFLHDVHLFSNTVRRHYNTIQLLAFSEMTIHDIFPHVDVAYPHLPSGTPASPEASQDDEAVFAPLA
jgi:hypothetical protein